MLKWIRVIHSQVSLYYKVLVANAVIIIAGAVLGTWLTRRLTLDGSFDYGATALLVLVGVALSLLVNIYLIRLAFQPLFQIEATLETIEDGNFEARAPEIDTDPDMAYLAQTINLVLDRLESYRRSVSSQILEALEQERQRIARELHDDTGQDLTLLIIQLEQSLDRVQALEDGERESKQVEQIREMVELSRDLAAGTLEGIRNLTFDLRPAVLDDLGLIPAVRWYLKNKVGLAGVEGHLQTEAFNQRLPDALEVVLFRVAQEALTNVVRHAQAEHVWVSFEIRNGVVEMHIRDDGTGFNVEEVLNKDLKDRGIGLFGMQERATLLGGRVRFESEQDRGTHVVVKIPLYDEEPSESLEGVV